VSAIWSRHSRASISRTLWDCPAPARASGFPAGTGAVQPNQFVLSNSAGLYYFVFQTNGWTGDLSVTFSLSEAGAVVQTVAVTGSVTAQQARSALVLSGSATIPQTAFVGPATLTATTTATPSNGAKPSILKSYSTLEVGGAGARRVVQAFVGTSTSSGASEFRVHTPIARLRTSLGQSLFSRRNFSRQATLARTMPYIKPTNGRETSRGPATRSRPGTSSTQYPLALDTSEARVATRYNSLGKAARRSKANYIGPAVLKVTTNAIQQGGVNQFALTSYATIVVQ